MDIITKLKNDKKDLERQLRSWVNCLPTKETEEDIANTKDIICSVSKNLSELSHVIDVMENVRGLGAHTVKMLVDQYYKEQLHLDENDNFIGEE